MLIKYEGNLKFSMELSTKVAFGHSLGCHTIFEHDLSWSKVFCGGHFVGPIFFS